MNRAPPLVVLRLNMTPNPLRNSFNLLICTRVKLWGGGEIRDWWEGSRNTFQDLGEVAIATEYNTNTEAETNMFPV